MPQQLAEHDVECAVSHPVAWKKFAELLPEISESAGVIVQHGTILFVLRPEMNQRDELRRVIRRYRGIDCEHLAVDRSQIGCALCRAAIIDRAFSPNAAADHR